MSPQMYKHVFKIGTKLENRETDVFRQHQKGNKARECRNTSDSTKVIGKKALKYLR